MFSSRVGPVSASVIRSSQVVPASSATILNKGRVSQMASRAAELVRISTIKLYKHGAVCEYFTLNTGIGLSILPCVQWMKERGLEIRSSAVCHGPDTLLIQTRGPGAVQTTLFGIVDWDSGQVEMRSGQHHARPGAPPIQIVSLSMNPGCGFIQK